MKYTILLTGCTGFLGGHLARYWVQKGHHVTALSTSCRRTPLLESVYDELEWFSYEKMPQAFAGRNYDAVVHCAGIYGRCGEAEAELVDINVRQSLEILAEAIKCRVEKFIYAGSGLPRSTSAYALSKAQFAEWLDMLASKHEGVLVNARLQHMYGPCDDESKFVTRIIRKMLNNERSIALTRGEQKRDFIYIDDVVTAFDTLLRFDCDHGFHEIDVGSGEAVSIRFLAQKIKELCSSQSELHFGEIQQRRNEPEYLRADISALVGLGWRCTTSLKNGLQKTVAAEKRCLHT